MDRKYSLDFDEVRHNNFYFKSLFCPSNFAFIKEFSICSNYSLADLWHSSCQFIEVIWRNFTPRFLKHSSSIISLVLHLTNFLLCDPNTSNLDLSVHNTFFQSSSFQCLCSFAHLILFFLLASLRYGFFFTTLPRRPASRSGFFTVDIETGVLRVPFNEAAIWGPVRRLFLKLETLLVLLLCCAGASHFSFYSG